MSKARTPFDILGVTPADDIATIRIAWRAKVRQLHPDVAGNREGSSERLAEVNAAFDALQGHRPQLRMKPAGAPRTADTARPSEPARTKQRKQGAKAPRKSDEGVARHAAQAAERARAEAIRARLRDHMATVHAKAATGYAEARKILAA